ncbi:hypothetical protein RI065_08145 [Mycoplasmatota bacterium zrk1]
MSYKVSINLKYDIGNSELVDNYYSTSSHSEIIRNILKGVNSKGRMSSHYAYGAYGSGKSMISTILVSLLSRQCSKNDISTLIKKFSYVDEDIASEIEEYINSGYKYIPVVLNGYTGSIGESFLNELSKVLVETGIRVEVPGIHNEIIKVIKRWKKEYFDTYTNFLFELNSLGYDIKDINRLLKSNDTEVASLFMKIYPKLTSGSNFNVDVEDYFVDVIESVCIQLNKKNIGLIFIYDEFGRYLKKLDSDDVGEFMQDMQNIAELTNNGVDNLQVLFVAHQPVNYYLSSSSTDLRAEFAKVEKRYNVYEIKSDYRTFLDIAIKTIKSFGIKKNNNISKENLIRYNLFAGVLNDTEVEKNVIQRLYPLHPVSVFLLPRISSVFGQNERTLFTFLNDESSVGLNGFVKNHPKKYYYPDYLVDYFFTNIDKSYVENLNDYSIYENNTMLINTIFSEDMQYDANRLYKFIFLWKVCRGNTNVKLSKDFIQFSTGLERETISDIITTLEEYKLTRYNTVQRQWEIFEGSSLNLDDEINLIKGRTIITDDQYIKTLDKYNPYRYIYAKRYNNKYEMTRFASLKFYVDDIGSYSADSEKFDSLVILSLNNPVSNFDKATINIVIDAEWIKIKDHIERLYVLDLMKDDSYYLLNYKNIDIDIDFEVQKIQMYLSDFYEGIFSPKSKVITKDGTITCTTVREFENYLSDCLEREFPSTLHIVNDQINMFKVTKIQEKAVLAVLNQILVNKTVDLDHIFNGSKPSDLIYYTTIKNIRGVPGNSRILELMKSDLLNSLKLSESSTLQQLLHILTSPPYGLRKHVAILVMFSLIIDKWDDMMLFRNGNYISSIDTSMLYYILLSNEDLDYSFSQFDSENRDFLVSLEKIFSNSGETVQNKSLSIRVCSGMYNWYMSLPIITQLGKGISMTEISFLKTIAYSRTNPNKAINDLLNYYAIKDILFTKQFIEDSFSLFVENFEKDILNKCGIEDTTAWISKQSQISRKNNFLVKTLLNEKSVVDAYATKVDKINIEKWTFSSFEKLMNLVLNDFNALKDEIAFESIVVNGVERVVQDVDLSVKGTVTLDNVLNTVEATRNYITESELEKIILTLVKKYVK